MELHSSKLTTLLLLWSVFCMWVMCMQVRGDAMTPQKCNTQTSESCQAMIGYVPGSNYNLSQIAFLFTLNYTALLGPNDIDPSLQDLSKLVLPGSSNPYSIPQTCGCSINGTRAVTSTNYTVVSGNTLSLISDTLYSQLVTYEEIAAVNGIADANKIFPGQVFQIPIPCACFNQSNTTNSSIFLSYQIQSGDSLSMIAATHNTTAAYLQELNSLPNSEVVESAVLFIPLSVCKANFSSGALDKDLTVVEGKYELTANGCVQCNCHNGTLHCIEAPSSLGSSCSNTTCRSSNIRLGTSSTSQVNGTCNVQSCVYKGYTAQSGIMSELETEQDPSCPVALPPESFYKPPLDLVASPLPGATPITTTSPPPPSTPAATPPTPTTNNPNSATTLLVGISFYSWWWWLLVASLLL